MTPPAPKELEALLAHAGWIRSLARTLVSDPNRADDLVQQTWVAALEHPPGSSVSPRRWLAAVMRNFARQVRRGDLRRLDRESQTARAEARPSAHESVEAIAVQRELFEAVIGLDEPYRSTIFERFYEDLPPREIARKHGVPVKTVKTRLSRGLEKLRADLDRRHGGRRESWLPALLPLAGWPGFPAPTVGMLVMNTKVKIAAATLLLIGAWVVVWTVSSENEHGTLASAGAEGVALAYETEQESPTLAESTTRESRAGAAATAPAVLPVQASVALVHGRVVDMRGLPMPGVPVCSCARVFRTGLEILRAAQHATSESVATTTADGSFSAPLSEDGATFVACGADLTTVFAADVWSSRAPQEVLVVVAPRGGVAGIVVDSEGRPIPEATIEIRPRPVVLRGLGAITDQSFEVPWRAKSDDGGRFEIPDAPAMADADLVTTAVGWSGTKIALPERPAFDLRIVLQGDEEEILRGEVVDPEGRPVSGARVACSTEATRTDEEGRFVLRSGSTITTVGKGAQMSPYVVQALKEGWLPARLAKRPENAWPNPIVLRLQGEPLAIQGRVLDEDGEAMVDVEVGSIDEHPFGIERNELGGGSWKSTEQLLRGGAVSVRTAGDGSFVLGGLLPGRYRLACLEKKTLRSATTEPTEAGTKGLVLTLASDARCVRVAGRVLTRAGAPLAGILVFPSHDRERWPFGDSLPVHGEGTVTDAEGRFEFERITPEGMALHFSSQDTIIVDWKPTADAKLDDLQVTLSRRCHLQIDLGDQKDMANYFSVLDEKGEKLRLWEHKGPMATPRSMSPINDGRSSVIAVSEEGRTVVLQRGNEEVARLPIELVPGALKILRP